MKLGALTFKSPSVYVLFKGKQPGQQVVRPHNALPLREDSTLRTIIQEAALMRFRKELDLSDSVITVAAAATLMPETPQDLADVVRIEEQSAETTRTRSCGCTSRSRLACCPARASQRQRLLPAQVPRAPPPRAQQQPAAQLPAPPEPTPLHRHLLARAPARARPA